MRRRRKNRSISFMTAVIVEVGSMLGIVAVAQPSWTRGLVEHLSPPAAVSVPRPAGELPIAGVPSSQVAASFFPTEQLAPAGWRFPTSHVAQLEAPAHARWGNSAGSLMEPVLPPSVASAETPPWGSGNGWLQAAPGHGYNMH